MKRKRQTSLVNHVAQIIPHHVETILDVGAGSGAITADIQSVLNKKITACDTIAYKKKNYPVDHIDDNLNRYQDKSFDAVLLIDVLHHTSDITSILTDCIRVSRKYIIIKDHIYNNKFDYYQLCLMDIIGNYLNSISMPYNYQTHTQWSDLFKHHQLTILQEISCLNLYSWPLSIIADRKLHRIWLLKLENEHCHDF
jgi:2-polyprenyl-3-methyl-5-hydroxy-6-metoxy-1,4-benzoquinol methylase